MPEIMEEYGYEREYMSNIDKHMSTLNFKHNCAMEELGDMIESCTKDFVYWDNKCETKRKEIQGCCEKINVQPEETLYLGGSSGCLLLT